MIYSSLSLFDYSIELGDSLLNNPLITLDYFVKSLHNSIHRLSPDMELRVCVYHNLYKIKHKLKIVLLIILIIKS